MLPSIGNEVLKSVVAQYQAEQLLTQRDQVRRDAARAAAAVLPPSAVTAIAARCRQHNTQC